MPECTECGLVFTNASDLNEHMRQMHAYDRTRETL